MARDAMGGIAPGLTMSSSLSAVRLRARYRFSSADDSSPVSSFSCCSFCSSGMLRAQPERGLAAWLGPGGWGPRAQPMRTCPCS